jgi:hypothetical protein
LFHPVVKFRLALTRPSDELVSYARFA